MTEQEKREKAIEEMAQIWCESDISCRDCVKCTIYEGKHCCLHLRNASDIYYYIISKVEEARNETAKEILQEIASPYYSVGDVYELTRHDIQELAEKFGVEVSDE